VSIIDRNIDKKIFLEHFHVYSTDIVRSLPVVNDLNISNENEDFSQ